MTKKNKLKEIDYVRGQIIDTVLQNRHFFPLNAKEQYLLDKMRYSGETIAEAQIRMALKRKRMGDKIKRPMVGKYLHKKHN